MKNIKLVILTFAILGMAACSDFLDINEDPNNPTTARINQLFPSIMLDISGAMGMTSGSFGDFTSLYVHQTVQRGTNQNDYGFNGSDFGVTLPWNLIYTRALTDIREVISIASESGDNAYVGISKILKAYSFSVLVDLYGDVPFTEANQGAALPFPIYDDDAVIYPQLLAMLDEGISDIEKPSPLLPGADDLFYAGDLAKWRKFAKTLQLKLYNQVRLTQDVSSEVNALLAEGDLIGPGDDFELQYGTNSGPSTRNPAYVQEYAPAAQTNYISPYFFEIMKGINTFFEENIYQDVPDPRIPYYFYNQLPLGAADGDAENPCSYCPSRSGTSFLSIWAFSFNIDPNEGFAQGVSQTVMGLYPVGGRYDDGSGVNTNFNGAADSPQRLLTYYDRLYIEAELAHAGVTSDDPKSLLASAMQASFNKVDEIAAKANAPLLSSEEVGSYIESVLDLYDSNPDRQLEHIMTQKWIANFGKGFDSYTDYRRTGFPILHNGDTDDLNVTDQQRDFPLSFPYITNSINTNPNAPEQKVVSTSRVFWDLD